MLDPGHPLLWATDVAAGLCLLAAGAVSWRSSKGTAVLLLAAGVAWTLAGFVSVTLFWHRALLVHTLLALPGWRPTSRVAGVVVAATYVACVFLPAALLDDRVTVVLSLALPLAAAWNVHGSTGRTRHLRRTAAIAATGLGAVLVASALIRISSDSNLSVPTLLAYECAVAGAALSVAAALRPARTDELTDRVIDLGEGRPGGLRDALASALRDPDVEVGFWEASTARYVDTAGRPVRSPMHPHRAEVTVPWDSRPFALIVVDASLARDPQVLASIEAATRLSAVNAQRQAEVGEQMRELEASRRRLLAAVDDEGGRLETELRAGIMGRLEDIVTELSGLSGSSHLERAMAHLKRTAADLDDIAAGLRPHELEHGLDAALSMLVDAPVEVDLEGSVGAVPEEIELAAWYLCTEALSNAVKYAPGARVSIRLERSGAHLRVLVTDDGPGGAVMRDRGGLLGLRDRVESLGGRLDLYSNRAGTRLVAELPLDDQ